MSALLVAAGWEYDAARDDVVDGLPQCKGEWGYYKHSQPIRAGDVWRMRVAATGSAVVGFAGQQYEPGEQEETVGNTAGMWLDTGSTYILADLSMDGQQHSHYSQLAQHIPQLAPFNLALRCHPDSNVPQAQFNEDGVWHDFAPEGSAALKTGPWFPYLRLFPGAPRPSNAGIFSGTVWKEGC
jgi:hypothetical protein